MINVLYSAVILDEASRNNLINAFNSLIPSEYTIIAHHMTINLGPIDPEYEKYLGMTVSLTAEDFAIEDKVIAVGVSGFYSKNKKPHITIAVNKSNGGKPMMSNYLSNWKKLTQPIKLTGKVTEITK